MWKKKSKIQLQQIGTFHLKYFDCIAEEINVNYHPFCDAEANKTCNIWCKYFNYNNNKVLLILKDIKSIKMILS